MRGCLHYPIGRPAVIIGGVEWEVAINAEEAMAAFVPNFMDGILASHTWSVVQQRAYLLDIDAAILADSHDSALTAGDVTLVRHEQDAQGF